ncbi:MAG TPA: DNA mismatch repair endonuclease MutL, partial [Chitinophagaceae bacterium]|nr:DNA mismatch repair endonuclease MutL [Chitinophagaceae bacterium]
NVKQRVLQLLGNAYNAKLVAVKEETDYMNIYGFVGKPETAKKTRGDQYLFVNNRFIRSAYLNHAVMSAYQEMISVDSFPMYALFLDLDPTQVDVNVHPTKQEIKFEDEKIAYAFVHAAIKHALAQFSITPALDFDLDSSIQQLPSIQQPFTEERQVAATSTSIFKGFTEKHQAHFIDPDKRAELNDWRQFFDSRQSAVNCMQPEVRPDDSVVGTEQGASLITHYSSLITFSQLHNQFILAETENGFILVNQQAAHERVLYEKLLGALQGKPVPTQRSMFPVTFELTPADSVLLEELISDLYQLGYVVELFGKNTFIIQGTPADLEQGNEKAVVEKLLEQYKHFSADLKFSKREKLTRSLAKQRAIKPGQQMTVEEMEGLVHDLFHCSQSNSSPDGRPIYLEFKLEQLEKMFGR